MTQSIVIADDDDTIRRLVEHKLSSAGYTVTAFENGQLVWDHLETADSPDLCILDVMMPGMNGIEILREVRDDPQLSNVPVIVLSSRGREEDVLKGIESGATDYMTKPFSPRELVTRVQRRIGEP